MGFKSEPEKPAAVPPELMPHVTIPDKALDAHPALKLRDYDRAQPDVSSNAISMVHNACRLEMSDMWYFIMPYLDGRVGNWTESESERLLEWWTGFARFALTTSMAEDMLMEISHEDILKDHDAKAREIGATVVKLKDRNGHTLVRAARVMDAEVGAFNKTRTEETFLRVKSAWKMVSSILCDTYTLVESTLDAIDSWRQDQFEVHKGLEKKIMAMYTNKKRWSDDKKRGEMAILLTRWTASEDAARDWYKRTLGSRDLRMVDKWFEEFNANRQSIVDAFKH